MIARFGTTQDGLTPLSLDFSDEGVPLEGETTVVGGLEAASAYAPFFERDLRKAYAHLFPAPEPEAAGPEAPGGDF